jgi:hypothetical protein
MTSYHGSQGEAASQSGRLVARFAVVVVDRSIAETSWSLARREAGKRLGSRTVAR